MGVRKSFLARGDFFICLLLVFIVVSGFYFYVKGRVSPIEEILSRNQELSVLFVIYNDSRPLLISYYIQNTQTKRGTSFDIPANTAVTISSLGRIDRVDKVFNPRSPEEFSTHIGKIFNLTKIPFYIFIDLKDLAFLVNFIRGVKLFVSNEINRIQDNQQLSIPSGSVLLDGAKASEYLILKEDHENSTHWIDRRQSFFMAFMRRLVKQVDMITHPRVLKHMHKRFQTNMKVDDILLFWKELALLDTENMGYQRLVGSVRMVDDFQLLFPADGQIFQEKIREIRMTLAKEWVGSTLSPTKIEIQNGTSRNGLGSRMAKILNSMGYDVVSVRNATETSSYTVVIDLNGNLETAQKIADIIRAPRIYSLASPNKEEEVHTSVDVSVILGNDFDGRYVQSVEE